MPDISWMELDGWAVRYHAGGPVTRRPGPEDVPGYFATAKLEYTAKPEVPFLFCDLVPRESLQGNEFWDLWDWNNQHASKDGDPSDISTKLLGHACPVQTYGMELECEKAHRKLYGTGVIADLIRARTEYACYLLSSTTLPVYQIADTCGYHSEIHFMRQFKEQTGKTPTEYRRSVTKED